jgi:hypothetical protein
MEGTMDNDLLTDNEARNALLMAAPDGFDWTLWTEHERIKYRTIAAAQKQKMVDEGWMSLAQIGRIVASMGITAKKTVPFDGGYDSNTGEQWGEERKGPEAR